MEMERFAFIFVFVFVFVSYTSSSQKKKRSTAQTKQINKINKQQTTNNHIIKVSNPYTTCTGLVYVCMRKTKEQ
jgi:preprotein translocase subunit YajC